MSEPLFPEGFVVHAKDLSIEEMKANEEEEHQGWGIKSHELGEGVFSSTVRAVHTSSLQLAFQTYSKPMSFTGIYPPKCILLYIAKSDVPPVVFNKKTLVNELCSGMPNEEVDVLINSSCTYYTLAVEEERFYKAFYDYFDLVFDEEVREMRMLIAPERLEDLFTGWEAWVKYLSDETLKMTYAHRYDAVEQEVLDFVFRFIVLEKKMKRRQKFDIALIREELEKNLESSIDIVSLAKSLNISERQLHNAFKVKYGLTPRKYLQNLRLNAVKEELLGSSKAVISEVAFNYNFKHMSHFTSEYKKLFGETPSMTLERHK